jgi:ribosomal protein S12
MIVEIGALIVGRKAFIDEHSRVHIAQISDVLQTTEQANRLVGIQFGRMIHGAFWLF